MAYKTTNNYVAPPYMVDDDEFDNQMNVAHSETFTIDNSEETSSSWSRTDGATLEIAASVGFDIPVIGATGSVTVTAGVSTSLTTEKATVSTVSWGKGRQVTVPACTRVRVVASSKKANLNLPYTATILYDDGTTSTFTGTYNGVLFSSATVTV